MADFDTTRRDKIRAQLRYLQDACSTLETSMKGVPDRDVDVDELEKLLVSITGQIDKFMEESFGPGKG